MWTRIAFVGVLSAVTVLSGCSTALGSVLSELGLRPSRLAALAARQDLVDMVAVLTTDGRLDNGERATILAKARTVLRPQEYASFKRALDQRWRPNTRVSAIGSPATARNMSGRWSAAGNTLPGRTAEGLVVPTGALLRD
ncbi:MAG: hypothetical protein LLG00_02940 [Planctomycetaceae bacterium]|nr:hypothetical protein [Planctomycetaceae bacterium]